MVEFLVVAVMLAIVAAAIWVLAPRFDPLAHLLFMGAAIAIFMPAILKITIGQGKEDLELYLFIGVFMFIMIAMLPLFILGSDLRMKNLLPLLKHPKASVRRKVVFWAKPKNKRGVIALTRALEDEDEEVRTRSARKLGGREYALEKFTSLLGHRDDSSAVVSAAVESSINKLLKDKEFPPEWIEEIKRLGGRLQDADYEELSFLAAPLPGMGQKLLTYAKGSLLTGSTYGGVLLATNIQSDGSVGITLPENCCLCDLYPATKQLTVTMPVVMLGKFTLNMNQMVEWPVPLCDHCNTLVSPPPGSTIPEYTGMRMLEYKKIEGKWRVKIGFLNEKVAERFRQLNETKVLDA